MPGVQILAEFTQNRVLNKYTETSIFCCLLFIAKSNIADKYDICLRNALSFMV